VRLRCYSPPIEAGWIGSDGTEAAIRPRYQQRCFGFVHAATGKGTGTEAISRHLLSGVGCKAARGICELIAIAPMTHRRRRSLTVIGLAPTLTSLSGDHE
jgi:hypothetical protein